MSLWFASHGDGIGMTSLCSHRIHIALMTSSRSDHDIIVTCVVHDRQTLRMTGRLFAHDISIMADNRQTFVRPKSLLVTGRPSHMIYRPW